MYPGGLKHRHYLIYHWITSFESTCLNIHIVYIITVKVFSRDKYKDNILIDIYVI